MEAIDIAMIRKQLNILDIQIQNKGCNQNCVEVLRSATTKLATIIQQKNDKYRKFITSKDSRGHLIFTNLLDLTNDLHVLINVITIYRFLLSFKAERAQVVRDIINYNILVQFLRIANHIFKLTNNPLCDNIMGSLYVVLGKIAIKDKKFSIKLRLMGFLVSLHNHLKFYGSNGKILNSILALLKAALSNVTNSRFLVKQGITSSLLEIVQANKLKPSMILCHALEATAALTRQKMNVESFINSQGLPVLLEILQPNQWSWKGKKGIKVSKIYKAIIQSLVHISYTKKGRNSLNQAQIITFLLRWCPSLPTEGESWEKISSIVSVVIQRCSPPLPLPIPYLKNPTDFNVFNYLTEDSAFKNDYRRSILNTIEEEEFSNMDSDDDSNGEEDTIYDEDDFENRKITNMGKEELIKYSNFFPELEIVFNKIGKSLDRTDDITDISTNGSAVKTTLMMSGDNQDIDCTNNRSKKKIGKSLSETTLLRSLSDNLPDQFSCPTKDKNQSKQGWATSVSTSAFRPHKYILPSFSNPELYRSIDCINVFIRAAEESESNKQACPGLDFRAVYTEKARKTKAITSIIKLAYPDLMSHKYDPPILEPLAFPNLSLCRSKILGHSERTFKMSTSSEEIVAFDLDQLLKDSSILGSPILNNDDEKRIDSDCGPLLNFESRFESGNLRKAIQIDDYEYNLIINPDINTIRHHQWFYFEVSGMEKGISYTFNIINCEKGTTLHFYGMSPVMFSVKESLEGRSHWVRITSDVCYYKNQYVKENSMASILKDKPFYTLTFSIKFPHSKDVCYLAYHYPYPYSLLQTHLTGWEVSNNAETVYFKNQTLCQSLTGNPVPVLTITANPVNSERPFIFLSSRVHPGESNSSWAMKGTIDYLLSNKESAKRLRENFIFKIVPMLNPDGVINGSFRCSLSGQDLNRQWIHPDVKMHPTIHYTKNLIHYLYSINKTPFVYCDYHGHSRKKNVFLFGCSPSQSWWPEDNLRPDEHIYEVLPILLQNLAPAFSIQNCTFMIDRNRESTARITVWREFNVTFSYTMECTYGGCDEGLYAGYHLGISQFQEMGAKLCLAISKLIPCLKKEETNYVFDPNLLPGISSLLYGRRKEASESKSSDDEEIDDDLSSQSVEISDY